MLTLHREVSLETCRRDDWLGPAPWIVVSPPGPLATAAIACDSRVMGPFERTPVPLVVRRAKGSVVEDIDGNRFLDFTAGAGHAVVGHSHPRVVAAIAAQADRLVHMGGRRFHIEPVVVLAHRIESLVPGGGLRRIRFCSGGTEALRLAADVARRHTGRSAVVWLGAAIPATACGGSPVTNTAIESPARDLTPDGYGDWPSIERCLAEAGISPAEIAAVVAEPISTMANYRVPPDDFFPRLRSFCSRHGILFVADETRTGVGRTGRLFGIEYNDIPPDLLCVASGLASGLPLAAVAAPESVAEALSQIPDVPAAANPVACAAALATLDLCEKGLAANAAELSPLAKEKLAGLAERHRCVSSADGRGLMLSVNVVRNRRSREPYADLRDRIVRECLDRGLIVSAVGPASIALCPPICINRVQLEVGLDVFAEAVATVHD